MTSIYKKILLGFALAVLVMTNAVFAQTDQFSGALEESAGNYPVMDMGYISSLGMQQKAWNNPMRHLGEGQTKPGYSRYLWKQDVVLPIRLREGMMTLVNFPTWELIENVWIGAKEAFAGEIAAPNALILYPTPGMAGVDSNLVVFGRSGNRYAFYVRTETYNTERITHSIIDIIVTDGPNANVSGGSGTKSAPHWASSNRGAGHIQPGQSLNPQIGLNTASNAPIDWLDNIPVNPEEFRFDLDIFIPNPDDVEIAPERVWRDEVFTYIDLGQKALSMNERPIVSLIIQGSESPVGFRTKGPHGRLIIVEAIGDLVLRNGKRLICIKLRKDPAFGLDKTDYAESGWYHQPPEVAGYQSKNGSADVNTNANTNGNMDVNVGMNGNTGLNANTGMNTQITVDVEEKDGLFGANSGALVGAPGMNNGAMMNGGVAHNQNNMNGMGNMNGMNQYGHRGMFDYNNGTQAGVSGSLMGGNATGEAPRPAGFYGYGFGVDGSNNSIQHQLQPLPKGAYDNGGISGIMETYNQISTSSGSGGYVNPYGVSGVTNSGDIAVELGSNVEINNLEKLWDNIYDDNSDILKGYEPYFSVDSKSNATGKEVFHLRMGPVEDVYVGDGLCKKLGRRGVKCSVVRIQ